MIRKFLLSALIALGSLAPATSAAPLEIIGVHTDLFVDWDSENERLRLSWNVQSHGALAPVDAYAHIRAGDWQTMPGGYEAYGVNAGDRLWWGPADFVEGTLYLGFSAALPSSAGFGNNVTFTLEALSGPGDLLLLSGASVVWSSFASGTDSLSISNSGHAHFDWLFTQQGLYTLTIGASVLKDGELVTTSENFDFHVGAIPEPAAGAALAGLLTLAIGGVRRPRRR